MSVDNVPVDNVKMKVKICGLTDAAMVDSAIAAGADFIGLVFFAKSPRHVRLDQAARLADRARGRTQIVALVVNAGDRLMDDIARHVRPDYFQLHGSEDSARVQQVKALTGRPVIKAVAVQQAADVARGLAYAQSADLVLFDAKPPLSGGAGEELPGGNGLCFDWRLLQPPPLAGHFMLAGGLTPDNVADAIRLTGAQMVDVSSGVERARGVKDAGLVEAFIQAAHSL